jgi:multiple sugar transport system permease protein
MAWESNAKSAWYIRFAVHLVLGVGAIFYLLPLIWMIATSFKPLDQTMKTPESLTQLFVGAGYRAQIADIKGDTKEYEVICERELKPLLPNAVDDPKGCYVVQPLKNFAAGEMWRPYGPDVWAKLKGIDPAERAMMDAPVTSDRVVLADDKNVFIPDAADKSATPKGTLTLVSGNAIPARALQGPRPAEEAKKPDGEGKAPPAEAKAPPAEAKKPPAARLVLREWRPGDADPKVAGAIDRDVTRAWDIKAEDDPKLVKTDRAIPGGPEGAARPNLYHTTIVDAKGAAKEVDVTVRREAVGLHPRPKPEPQPYGIVRPEETFAAGELWLGFSPEEWNKNRAVFGKQELELMETPVSQDYKVLADDKNVFVADPGDTSATPEGALKLCSGHVIRAQRLRSFFPPPEGEGKPKLVVVREWRSEDTNTKEVGSTDRQVTRAWDVKSEDDPTLVKTARFIPENYPAALERTHFLRSLLNTLYVCSLCVVGVVISSVLVAYGFAFLEFKGRDIIFGLTMATMMIPFVITMIPLYILYRHLGWIDTFKPLWVTAWFGGAFFIFLLRQFFLGLPKDLLDAARIDGCTELEILWHVIVPLSRPAIAMVALFTFIGTWKDFMGPLIYLNHESQFTLSLSLQSFQAEHGGTPWHLLMAASTVFSLPLIILFFLTMKTFIRGIAMTGIKG